MPSFRSLSFALPLFATALGAAEPVRSTSADLEPDTTRYEFQVIHAKPGKLDALQDWFRAHQEDVLAKHGATNIASFTPADENPDRKLVCLLRFPDLSASMNYSRAVKADPLWKPLDTSSDGPERLVESVSVMHFTPTSFSPDFEPGESAAPRVFELRTYTCPSPEKLARLRERFRDHTMGLFAKHGMENLVYWEPLDLEDADRKLVYLLAHRSREAADESFASFRKDPDWLKAKRESEEQAGGSLTSREGGVVSEFFMPTGYSPLK